MRRIPGALVAVGVAALALTAGSANAHVCDFLTGGGFIMTTASGAHPLAKANFGVAGGCKKNVPDQHGPYWGHLEYVDHGNGLNVHWLTITAYIEYSTSVVGNPPVQPEGARIICGTARTNQPYGDVYFKVYAEDVGEPGRDDRFFIRLRERHPVTGLPGAVVYTTEGDFLAGGGYDTLGGPGPGGGNLQLHRHNPSNIGEFGGECRAE